MDDQLMAVSCDPTCGFKIQSHNKKEIVEMVKKHVAEMHQKSVSDGEVEEMMTAVGGA